MNLKHLKQYLNSWSDARIICCHFQPLSGIWILLMKQTAKLWEAERKVVVSLKALNERWQSHIVHCHLFALCTLCSYTAWKPQRAASSLQHQNSSWQNGSYIPAAASSAVDVCLFGPHDGPPAKRCSLLPSPGQRHVTDKAATSVFSNDIFGRNKCCRLWNYVLKLLSLAVLGFVSMESSWLLAEGCNNLVAG